MKEVNIFTLVDDCRTWSPSHEAPSQGLDYVDLSAVSQETKTIDGSRHINGIDAPSRARQLIQQNDVLVSTVRPNLNGVAIVTQQHDGATASTGFCVLRPRERKLHHNYLFHWVLHPEFIRRMTNLATGASYPAVSDRIIKQSTIPLPFKNGEPDFEEQKRIAALLDKADALRRKRQEALRLTDDFLRSTFLDMFGSYLDKNASDLFANVLAMPLNNGFFAKNDQYGSGTPVIWVDNLYHTSLINTSSLRRAEVTANDLRKYGVLEGDLLFTRSSLVRDGIGQCNVVPCLAEPMAFECHIIRARVDPKKANPRYIQALYRSDFGKAEILRRANTATMTTISQGSLEALPCPLPPIELQNRFAAIVQAIEKTASSMAATLESNNTLFSALQQRAFSGEL